MNDITNNKASEEGQAFLSSDRGSEDALWQKRTEKRGISWYLRLFLEIAMAATIVGLLVWNSYLGRDTIKRTPVPRLPRKLYTFQGNSTLMHDKMFFNKTDTLHTLHNWIPLSSASRGYIVVKDAHRYDLPNPYTIAVDRYKDGPGYMMTVFHQLHCLSYLVEHYQEGYDGVKLTEEVAHHTAHCFNYIRQGLMCSADVTLEGKTDAGPGEGSEHECVDYDALLEWANNHSAMKWRNVPDEATL
ncbi:hypothetical protein AOL_s00210g62 [Orbilia oligospora ATCC 24927]|uniref:Oxidase ustYa n=2 Tax=Orbilia oligospora TaxID=2813651 RepID=G1XRR8_ARTOA|nr:hypothetical protein AOL_s00210g62 [Orbilia oligospora ATCC 24927]EGX44190.1 hypothetical protein AOL_s00210g62 [Orbilia oligospora ATCC 24927]